MLRKSLLWKRRPRERDRTGGELRFVVISDTHVGSHGDEERLGRLLAVLEREEPAFVLHGGDLVNDTVARPGQVEAARRCLGGLGAPLFMVPGNHDVATSDPDLLAAWTDAFGAARFSFSRSGLRFVGFNAQALTVACGDVRQQEEELEFLAAESHSPGERVVLLYHLPQVIVPRDDLYQLPWTERALKVFGDVCGRVDLAAAIAGHWHLGVRVPRWAAPKLTVAPAVSGRFSLPTGYLRCVARGGELEIERVMVETDGKRELPAVVRMALLPEGRLPQTG